MRASTGAVLLCTLLAACQAASAGYLVGTGTFSQP